MKKVECEGLWWLPENPSHHVGGVLKVDKEGLPTLRCFGSLSTEPAQLDAIDYPIILGLAANCPFGNPVTLIGNRCKSQSLSIPGFTTETFFAQRALFGDHLPNPVERFFSGMTLSLSGLSSWADTLTGFSTHSVQGDDRAGHWTITYESPPPLSAPFPFGEARLGLEKGLKRAMRVYRIKERVVLNVQLTSPVSDDVWQSRYVYPLQNLLTLATDTPNAVTGVTLFQTADDVSERGIKVIAPRTFADSRSATDLILPDMLFSLRDIAPRFAALLPKWLQLYERYERTLNLYFGLQYRSRMFLDVRFMLALQALCLFFRLQSPKRVDDDPLWQALLTSLPPTDSQRIKAFVSGNLLYQAEIALPALLQENHAAFDQFLARGQKAFISEALNTLYYVQSRDPVVGLVTASGRDLYSLVQRLLFLMKICLLAELGLTPSEIGLLLRRNRKAQFLLAQSKHL